MLGWTGTVFCIAGSIFTIYKRRCGFLFTLMGCILWGIEGTNRGIYSLVLVETVFVGLSLYGWYRWAPSNEKPGVQ